MELIDVGVHAVGRCRAHRAAGVALGRLGGAGVENRVVLEVVGHALACVEASFQLGVGDVAGHDDGSLQIDARRNGVFRQLAAHGVDALIQVDFDGVLTLAGLGVFGGNQLGGVRVHFLKPNAVFVDFRLDVAVGGARNAHSDGARGAVARQADDADVVGQIFAAELRSKPDFLGFLEQFFFQVDVAEGASRLVARRGQRIVVFNRREFHRQQVLLCRSATNHKRDVVGRTGRRAKRFHLFDEERQQRALVLNCGLGHRVEIGLVGRTAAFRHHHKAIFGALAGLNVDLCRQVAARVHLVVHVERRILRVAQVFLGKRLVNAERQGFFVLESRPHLLSFLAVDDGRARVLTEGQHAASRHLGVAQELQGDVFIVF